MVGEHITICAETAELFERAPNEIYEVFDLRGGHAGAVEYRAAPLAHDLRTGAKRLDYARQVTLFAEDMVVVGR